MDHIVIRREEYVSGTRERPEIGIFTQAHQTRHPVPWGQIAVGDTVWMKWSSGPIVAAATVQGFRQIESCSAERLREMTAGSKLFDLRDYWESLPPAFSAVVIWREESGGKLGALEDPGPAGRVASVPDRRSTRRREAPRDAYPHDRLCPQISGLAAGRFHLPVLRPQASRGEAAYRPCHPMVRWGPKHPQQSSNIV